MFSSETVSEGNFESLLLFLFHGTEFRVVFSSAEWFWNRILGVYYYFYSMKWNSELFSLPRNGSERNSALFCTDGILHLAKNSALNSLHFFVTTVLKSDDRVR
jgi:hypothetical protein